MYFWGHWSYTVDHNPRAHFLFDDQVSILDWSSHHQRYSMHFESVHEFAGFLRGYDTRAPAMKGYYSAAGVRAQHAIQALEDTSHFRVQLTGTNLIEQDADADYSVVDVKGLSDDDVKGRFGKAGAPVPPSTQHHVVRGARA